MAVYTHLDFSAARDWIAAHYPCLPLLRSMQGISEGVENSNYLLHFAAPLHAEESRGILTLYEKRVEREALPYYLGLMAHLHAQGCAVPMPFPRGDAALHGPILAKGGAAREAALVSFVPGRNMAEPNVARLHALGRAMAQLHQAGMDFTLVRENNLSPLRLRPLLESGRPWMESIAPGLAGEIADELTQLAAAMPSELPRGNIHADLFRDNVFFEAEKVSGLIDFYFACSDWLVYDLAITAISWCMESAEHALDTQLLDALLQGYETERGLQAGERAALPWLMRGAALRFMLTRAHDFLRQVPGAQVVVKDPGEYLAKWRMLRAWSASLGMAA